MGPAQHGKTCGPETPLTSHISLLDTNTPLLDGEKRKLGGGLGTRGFGAAGGRLSRHGMVRPGQHRLEPRELLKIGARVYTPCQLWGFSARPPTQAEKKREARE